ncbi:hypothetical protein [Granulicoccus phenolivorans]|uniref:hypothetical protein n=1 Tax=Granulicoccus phenolivorans TaxID=266854 RepID=UPI0004098D98|nr:hypothetical protein [Granulicoccus phenolivorans]
MRRFLSRSDGRWIAGGAAVVVLGLVVGQLIAGALSNALAVRFVDKQVPAEQPTVTDALEVTPLAPLAGVELPESLIARPRLTLADRLVRQAVAGRTPDPARAPVTVSVRFTDAAADDEGYAVAVTGDRITVTGSELGAGNGLFRIADQLAAGHPWSALGTAGVVRPALADRFVDTGAVGVRPDPAAYRLQQDYQHASGALEDVVLAEAPYVDEAALARVDAEWRDYIDHVVAYGYNGVVIGGFLEYVNFDRLGDGQQIYPADSPYRARHNAMKHRVGAMWRYAHEMGLRVVFKSDMLALTGPLQAYLERETGMNPSDPRLWAVYRAGLDEFFADFDWVDGFMIRIGEGGSIYNHPGWDYFSRLAVTDAAGVRTMLDTFTGVAAEHGATIYFRTWSVGVGDIGDMHTNPATYQRLLGDFQRDNLVVSTKFVSGDFDSWLPLNPTLRVGQQRRLIEMQGRREFETFSAVPDDMGPAHQQALRELGAANPHIDGLWLWTQDGGPWRAGPMSLYLKDGNWKLYDHNVYTAARLAWDPDTDLGRASSDWIHRSYSHDPATVAAIGSVLHDSRAAILDGLYLRPYAEKQVFALGLEPPPMMWIFKWDIVSGDAAALSAVYVGSRGRVDEAIAAGEGAVTTAERMRAAYARADRATFTDPADHDRLAAALDYEVDLLRTLQTWRVLFLRHYEWLDTGSPAAQRAWQDAVPAYRAAVAAHEARWGGNLDLPPYNFFAADIGLTHLERTPPARFAAVALLALGIGALLVVPSLRRGAFTPWRVAGPAPGRAERIATWAVPAVLAIGSQLVFSAAASPWYLVVSLGFLGCTALVPRLLVARTGADPHALWSALGGSWLLGALFFLGALAWRGPGGYWLRLFTADTVRSSYVTLATALVAWWLYAIVAGLHTAYGLRVRQGIGAILGGFGLPVALVGALLAAVGLERGLTTLNDEMAILPLGLSRILGLTVHLGIPSALPTWLVGTGAGLLILGAALAVGRTGNRRGAARGRKGENARHSGPGAFGSAGVQG